MAKAKTVYRCSACGATCFQWMGRCPQCSEWNSLSEEQVASVKPRSGPLPVTVEPTPFAQIDICDIKRLKTGIGELDRVLGGGIVDGSLVLVGGDPGVGKSTLMLQMARCLAEGGSRVLYVSGEESARQIRMRGERLGVASADILIYPEVVLENIHSQTVEMRPDLVIVDSIQSVYSLEVDGTPGSVSQVRHAAGILMEIAKRLNIPVFVIGHVTKDGWIAGPRMLEHMVDTVIYFEGRDSGAFRVLRAVKNRFGPAGEIGVFEMAETGLAEVSDPSGMFIHGLGGEYSGSIVMPAVEGSRALLVEVQALVNKSGFSQPRRIAMGVDLSRLAVLLAVMEKRAGVFLSGSDVVLNLAGGMRVNEPAADLAVVLAVASGALDRPVGRGTVCFGEVGLNGEIRPVAQISQRIREAERMGFKRVILPEANGDSPISSAMEIVAVKRLKEAVEFF